MRTVVLDTNVLLSDPEALFAFPGAEVIVPETVLGELDKVKTGRVDPDLRYRGREVSRMLFDLSEAGPLTDGVEIDADGSVRVVALDSDTELPTGLSTRNADDRILAVAFQVCQQGCDDLTLVTNDLNMLLKAQTFGIRVERHENGLEASFGRRYIVQPFRRYKIPLGILAISLAVFAAIVVLTLLPQAESSPSSGVPTEFRGVLSDQQESILDLLVRLEDNPADSDALLDLANEYHDFSSHSSSTQIADLARRYYEQYLQLEPGAADARTDLATIHFTLGDTDKAIQEVTTVLQSQPDHLNANYNLGIFYWKGRGDFPRGAAQFRAVIALTEGSEDPNVIAVYDVARNSLTALENEAAAAGVSVAEPEES